MEQTRPGLTAETDPASRSEPAGDDPDVGRGRGLRVQLIGLLGLAVLPAIIFAVVDGFGAYGRSLDTAQRGFLNASAVASQPLQDRLVRMTSMARLLAELPAIRRFDGPACDAALAAVAQQEPALSAVAVLDGDGRARCAAPGTLEGAAPLPASILTRMRNAAPGSAQSEIDVLPRFAGETQGVVAATRPMIEDGALIGLVAVFLPLDALDWWPSRSGPVEPAWRAIVDAQRDQVLLLRGDDDLDAAAVLALPGRREDLAPEEPWLFEKRMPGGPEMLVAMTPLVTDRLWLANAAPAGPLQRQALLGALPRIAAPLAVLLVALLAAYVAMDRLVVRHLIHLARVTRAFGRGRLGLRPNLPANVPREIAELASDLSDTAEALESRQKDLEAAASANRLLLMEVYHRVKNNLQMVGSFVNLQARRASDPAGRAALEPIRARVHAMSLVHEMLYRSADLETVSLDDLLAEIARSIVNAGAPPPALSLDLEARSETQERAIPLALFVNECVTNAVRHAAPDGRPEVRMSLRNLDDGGLALSVENDADDTGDAAPEDGLGARLTTAFARQMRADLRTERQDGVHRVTLVAPPPAERRRIDDPERVF